ncbi:MAG: septum formation initiator family protein [Pseudomonadota bacterium]
MKRGRRAGLVLLTAIAIAAYFTHHIRSGKYGLETQARLDGDLLIVRRQIQGLETVRTELRRDIALLTASPPSTDLVEELARTELGYAYPSDRIVIPGPASDR